MHHHYYGKPFNNLPHTLFALTLPPIKQSLYAKIIHTNRYPFRRKKKAGGNQFGGKRKGIPLGTKGKSQGAWVFGMAWKKIPLKLIYGQKI